MEGPFRALLKLKLNVPNEITFVCRSPVLKQEVTWCSHMMEKKKVLRWKVEPEVSDFNFSITNNAII